MSWRWPVAVRHELPDGRRLSLRPLERADRAAWEALRRRNEDWLRPWESTAPGEASRTLPFPQLRRVLDRGAKDGLILPFVIDVDGEIVGQIQLFDVLWGARRSGWAGYWLDQEATGRGVATWALAALVDHVLLEAGLHRVEVAIRPENTASLAVAARLRLPEEGTQRGLMHVDGQWADHRLFAIVVEDLRRGGYAQGGLVPLLHGRAG
ncbi:Ribosomal-protein-S5p-alanine acetyltransferase [Serinicoccus hydrothermalis]|uniref:Ribosomal-protein-S5p-alanine acetyltransferase n=1 Tax=Serinicoccus hydrothermalis TaxID=1758689 RepID=A0A1B1NBH4_9MICO|nr:GNAT family protein [Serinicoccus hydrothermalis]ANS78772.1 Ribosomal-protein-S5p-alanine acetyltransferase [Serinicoccus hydrothermalis]